MRKLIAMLFALLGVGAINAQELIKFVLQVQPKGVNERCRDDADTLQHRTGRSHANQRLQ